jgi:hypothetical protein
MESYDQSTRSRYWRESTQSVFGSVFRREPSNQSGFMLTVIFVVTVVAIVLLHNSDSVFWVFLLGVVFAGPFLGRNKVQRGVNTVLPGAAAPGQAISPEAERLLAALEQLEKRLGNLETIVTQREFDWERRLNQEPPRSAGTGVPGGGSPLG